MNNILNKLRNKFSLNSDEDQVIISEQQLLNFFNNALHSNINKKQQQLSKDKLAGENISTFNGQGMDYSESRTYITGDDVRRINWKQSARSGVLISNIFHQENNNIDYIILDRRKSMYFGTQVQTKISLAVKVAILSAISSIKNNKSVKIISILDTVNCSETIDSFEKIFLYFSKLVKNNNNSYSTQKSIGNALKYLNSIRPSSCSVTIISDFNDINKDSINIIKALTSENYVNSIKINDKIEISPPPVYPINYKTASRINYKTASRDNSITITTKSESNNFNKIINDIFQNKSLLLKRTDTLFLQFDSGISDEKLLEEVAFQ